MLQSALQPTQNQYTPASPGFGGNIGASMFGGLAQGFGQQMGQGFAGQSPSTGSNYQSGTGYDQFFRNNPMSLIS